MNATMVCIVLTMHTKSAHECYAKVMHLTGLTGRMCVCVQLCVCVCVCARECVCANVIYECIQPYFQCMAMNSVGV